jgi:hypothetical protein
MDREECALLTGVAWTVISDPGYHYINPIAVDYIGIASNNMIE